MVSIYTSNILIDRESIYFRESSGVLTVMDCILNWAVNEAPGTYLSFKGNVSTFPLSMIYCATSHLDS